MHSVIINYNNQFKEYESLDLASLAKFALDKYCRHKSTCCSINFVSSSKIHSLNKDYRDVDSPTDVLSFECDSFNDSFDIEDNFELGDIFICPEVAIKNSNKFNTSIDSEIKLLTVHGLLHLCGYDHINKDQAEQMEKFEDEILDAWESKKI